jgi:hypothetical protein
MASNCEDVTARMMELLYGELPADARASVDAHVAGCARCRAELDGFEKTRAIARRGLDEAPPARARAAIMQAAAAHLAAQPQTQPATVRRAVTPAKVSFWDRLRTRWTFPTLATIGAVAVFMVANRVFLNPERTLAPRPSAEAPSAPVLPEPGMAEPSWKGEPPEPDPERPVDRWDRARGARNDESRAAAHHGKGADGDLRAPGKKMKKGEDAESELAERTGAKGGARAEEKPKRDRNEPAENRFAPPPPPRDGTPAGQSTNDWADKAVAPREHAPAPIAQAARSSAPAKKAAPARAGSPAQAQGSLDDLLSGESQREHGAGGNASGKGALGGLAEPQRKSESYGSGAAAAQPAPAAPRPTTNEMRRQAPVAAAPPPTAAPAPPAPPPPAALTKSRAKKSSDVVADEAFEGAPEASAAKDEKKVSAKSNANDAIMQRADRLFADGRWAEAAALYRELLRRDPRSDGAERWRRRLVAAENADVNEKRNANVAARRAAPAQDKADAESAARAAKPTAKAAAKASKAAASDAAQ